MVHDDRRLASRRVPSRRPHQARHLWHQDTIPACPVRCALHACACVRAVCEAKVPGLTHRSPSSILFDVPASLGAIITESTARAAEQIADLDLQVRYFEDYGKGFVKRYVCAVRAMCVRAMCVYVHACCAPHLGASSDIPAVFCLQTWCQPGCFRSNGVADYVLPEHRQHPADLRIGDGPTVQRRTCHAAGAAGSDSSFAPAHDAYLANRAALKPSVR